MTPLLPYPLPWPVGEALAWSNSRGWEGMPVLGSLAIQPVPHRVDEEVLPAGMERWFPREGIPDLLVRCRGSREMPSFHAANGYALDLDGERPDAVAPPGTVEEREGRLCLPVQPSAGSSQSWVERIPVLDQGLVQGISAGTTPTGHGSP